MAGDQTPLSELSRGAVPALDKTAQATRPRRNPEKIGEVIATMLDEIQVLRPETQRDYLRALYDSISAGQFGQITDGWFSEFQHYASKKLSAALEDLYDMFDRGDISEADEKKHAQADAVDRTVALQTVSARLHELEPELQLVSGYVDVPAYLCDANDKKLTRDQFEQLFVHYLREVVVDGKSRSAFIAKLARQYRIGKGDAVSATQLMDRLEPSDRIRWLLNNS